MKLKYFLSAFGMILAILITSQTQSADAVLEEIPNDVEIENTVALARAEGLQLVLNEAQEKNLNLSEQIEIYRKELELYTQIASEAGGYSKILSEQLTQAQILAGLTKVEGQGIVVTMSDSVVVNSYGFDENNFLIHNEDILRVINELRDAGAEAISVNGERILSTSEIICSGSTVRINNNKYASPYVIKAIGNASQMEGALRMRGGVLDILSEWGIEITINQEKSIIISAYDGAVSQKYISIPSEE